MTFSQLVVRRRQGTPDTVRNTIRIAVAVGIETVLDLQVLDTFGERRYRNGRAVRVPRA